MAQETKLLVQEDQKPQTRSKDRVKAENRYPVYDLDNSIAVARVIRDQGGGNADYPHLASYLDYNSTRSGAFISRVAATRRFGLVEDGPGGLIPTALAMRIIAPERPGVEDAVARKDAFLNVTLYRNLYQRYKDTGLPQEVGLRNALETNYGVPKAQTTIAVRVFLDSADQAGFFAARGGARTHLVMPAVTDAGLPSSGGGGEEPTDDAQQQPRSSTLPPPASAETANEQLRRVLVEKIREIPATELDTIREYIKIIRQLGEDEEGESAEH
jgi:hypothetical protein